MPRKFNDFFNFVRARPAPAFIVVSFLVWLFIFRDFLSGHFVLTLDAVSYYRQIGVYLSSIAEGVYPLWEPSWRNGVPIEFFSRRIGNFNPFFYPLIVLDALGMSYRAAYGVFLAAYYFLGMTGFYLLARRVIGERKAAFFAFVLLLFSSLSTTLFFSYIVLIFTPYFWFFFFFISFFQDQKVYQLLGITFTLMLILTTYIPFYFIIIFLVFLLCYVLLYARDLPRVIRPAVAFIGNKRMWVALCVLAIGLSVLPGYSMYKSGSKAETALPARHQNAADENVFSVSERNIKGGDIASQVYFDRMIFDLDRFRWGVVYLPVFGLIVLLLGTAARINKRTVLLVLLGWIIFLIGLTDTTKLYHLLHEKVFFFKFIRQWYYFFWVLVLPVIVLIAGLQARQIFGFRSATKWQRRGNILFVSAVHLGALIFLLAHGDVILMTYPVIVLSYGLCLWQTLKPDKGLLDGASFYLVILALVVIQAFQAYHYLGQNARESLLRQRQADYDLTFEYVLPTAAKAAEDDGPGITTRPTDLYYATRWYYLLFREMDYGVFRDYIAKKFIVYDRVRSYDNDMVVIPELQEAIAFNRNLAFVRSPGPAGEQPLNPGAGDQATVIKGDSERFEVTGFNANGIRFRTDFDRPKFLVYNDSYHTGWHAFINGKEAKIYRANVAFKGLWLPAGENNVYLRFGSSRDEIKGFLFMGLFVLMPVLVVIHWYRERNGASLGDQ